MFLLNDIPLQVDTAFTHDDLNYPANWLRIASLEEKQAIGITEVPNPVEFDERFYCTADNPKDLSQLKAQWIRQINNTAFTLLSPTDWMIMRTVERSIAVPKDTAAYREQVLTECNRLTSAIAAATTVPELVKAISTQAWPADSNSQMI